MSLTLQGRRLQHDFAVVDSLAAPLILGMDVLEKARVIVDAASRSVEFNDVANTRAAAVLSPAPSLPRSHLPALQPVLLRFASCFAASADAFGTARVEPLFFKVDASTPLRSFPYRLSRPDADFINKTVEEWLAAGRIRPSDSPWACPAHVVPKDGGGQRLVINFQRLNALITPDNQPMPRARDIFDSLTGARVFSKFDFQSAYLQIPVAEECRPYLSFVTEQGQFEFCFVPFGLNIAGNKLQRELNRLFSGIPHVYGYADDWIIATPDASSHATALQEFMRRVQTSGFLLKASKSVVGATQVKFLGRVVDAAGIRLDPEDAATIAAWQRPRSPKELQRFLGLGRWCAEFAPGYAQAVRPLHRLANSRQLQWSEEAELAFSKAKAAIGDALLLSFPNFNDSFVLETDASAAGFGAILRQGPRVVRIAHRATTPAESALPATLLELAALCWAVRHFHVYLHGRRFQAITDHRALSWLKASHQPPGKLALWAAELAQYDFDVVYKPGRLMGAADAISRSQVIAAAEEHAWPSPQELAAAQDADRDCQDLRRRLEAQDPRVSAGWITNSDGVLCSHSTRYGLPSLKPFIPSSLRQQVLASIHQRAGHLAGETVRLAKATAHWPAVARDAATYAAGCSACQEAKSPRGKRNLPEGTVTASRPFEIVAMDIMGPLPAVAGKCYILVMSDYFTRYAMAVPLTSKSCAEVASTFEAFWATPFGWPASVLTDQGGEFSGHELSNMFRRNGVQRRSTTAYHPQGDGMVERLNQTLIQILTTTIKSPSYKSDWPSALPAAVRAFNAATSSATGHPPYFLLFGVPPTSPPLVEQPTPSPPQLLDAKAEFDAARKATQDRNSAKQRAVDLKNATSTSYVIGDLVMVKNLAIKQRPLSKLHRQWVGPCRILQVRSKTNYVVRQVTTPTPGSTLFVGTVNIANMKPFRGPLPTTPARDTKAPTPCSTPISAPPTRASTSLFDAIAPQPPVAPTNTQVAVLPALPPQPALVLSQPPSRPQDPTATLGPSAISQPQLRSPPHHKPVQLPSSAIPEPSPAPLSKPVPRSWPIQVANPPASATRSHKANAGTG
jgi:transposase InsO family protein